MHKRRLKNISENLEFRANTMPLLHEILGSLSSIKASAKGLSLVPVRKATMALAQSLQAPNTVAQVATTYLGLGLSQEMATRFVLEYVLKTKRQDIAIIFIAETSEQGVLNFEPGNKGHVLVFVGKLAICPKYLIGVGNSAPGPVLGSRLVLKDFIKRHANKGIFVDPFLKCLGSTESELKELMAYSQQWNAITISGVRSFAATDGFSESAPGIKENALQIACRILSTLVVHPVVIRELALAQSSEEVSIPFTDKNAACINRLALAINRKNFEVIRPVPESACAFFDKKWLETVVDYHRSKSQPSDTLKDIETELGVSLSDALAKS